MTYLVELWQLLCRRSCSIIASYDKTLTAASIEDLITGTSNNSSTSGFNSFSNKFGSRTNEQSVLEHITSGTIDKLNPEQISGKLIGRVTNPAEFSTTMGNCTNKQSITLVGKD